MEEQEEKGRGEKSEVPGLKTGVTGEHTFGQPIDYN